MTTVYPGALHPMPNPGPTTYRDDPGYELDSLVAQLGDIAEALQVKLGLGASVAAVNQVLRGTAAGASAFGQIQTLDLVTNATTQRAASGVFTGTRTASGYADVDSTNGKVTLTTVGGDLLVWMVGNCSNTNAGIAQNVALKLDSGGEGGIMPVYSLPGAATFPLAFVTMTMYPTPAAGSHTIIARHANVSATGTMSTTAQIFVLEARR